MNAHADMEVIGEAKDGRDAWQRIVQLRPNIALIDVSLPEIDGIKVTEKVKSQCPGDIRPSPLSRGTKGTSTLYGCRCHPTTRAALRPRLPIRRLRFLDLQTIDDVALILRSFQNRQKHPER